MKNQIIIISLFAAKALFAQAGNLNFESWLESETDTIPEHWTMSFYGSGRTTDAYEGSYAATIWNWYSYAKGTLTNGGENIFESSLMGAGQPIQFKPSKLKGYYKYYLDDNIGEDSARIYVMLKKYDALSNKRDTIGYGYAQLPPAANWTSFEVPIADFAPAIEPDSIAILFLSSISGFCSPSSECCYLSVDALSIEDAAGVTEPANGFENLPVRLFFVENELFVAWNISPPFIYHIDLYDYSGKLVQSWKNLQSERQPLVMRGEISSGIYLFEITSDTKFLARGKIRAN